MQRPRPLTLQGSVVKLEPLHARHLPGLMNAGRDPAVWRWMPGRLDTQEAMKLALDTALAAQASGSELPFATLDASSGDVIGSTRYLNIAPEHRRVEIGWTWLAPAWQRTAANTEAKLLMLTHAFETLGCRRVEFKTDSLNERSRAALLGVGAIEEGTLRNHMVMPDGRLRHSVYYSVIDTEWPAVKELLQARLRRPRG